MDKDQSRRDRVWRSVTYATASVFSCLVVYPLIHEAGHLLPAVLSGAEVDRFVWTPLIGTPHVSLSGVSGAAQPWVDAGGILLPTGIGTLMMAIWLSLPCSQRAPLRRLWLLIPSSILLIGNLGLFWEAWASKDTYHHLTGLVEQLVGDDGIAPLCQLAPALWSCVLIGLLILRWCRARGQAQSSDQPEAGVN